MVLAEWIDGWVYDAMAHSERKTWVVIMLLRQVRDA